MAVSLIYPPVILEFVRKIALIFCGCVPFYGYLLLIVAI